MVESALKPCPFCGGEAQQLFCTANGAHTTIYFNQKLRGLNADHSLVLCKKCGNRTKVFMLSRNAIKAWNRRAENGKA